MTIGNDSVGSVTSYSGFHYERLERPHYLAVAGRDVIHLTSPAHVLFQQQLGELERLKEGDLEEKDLSFFRSFNGKLWCDFAFRTRKHVFVFKEKPQNYVFCKRCVRSVQSELLKFVNDNFLYYVTEGVKNLGIKLDYYYVGNAMTSCVGAKHGKSFGSIAFIFKDKNKQQAMRRVEVELLDVESWSWIACGENKDVADIVAGQIANKIEQREQMHQEQQTFWQGEVEDGLF